MLPRVHVLGMMHDGLMSYLHTSSRLRNALSILALVTVANSLSPAIADAATHYTITIRLSLVDSSLPGQFLPNDTLRLTTNVFVDGRQANTGALFLYTTNPQEPRLCVVSYESRQGHFCVIDFPNAGRWRIVGKFALSFMSGVANHFNATKAIAATIFAPAPPSTISYTPQATSTVFGSGSFNQLIGGKYFPIEDATVTITGQGAASPGGGSVIFTDAYGNVICGVSVSAVPQVGCTGVGRSSPPVNPVTATYTGTNLGISDGIGYVYAPSSGSAYVP
jgi:hypothetical protein